MTIRISAEAWTGEKWLVIEVFNTDDVLIMQEKLRQLCDLAMHPGQEWPLRAVVAWEVVDRD